MSLATPFASYDFNSYTASADTLVSSVGGQPDMTVVLPLTNTLQVTPTGKNLIMSSTSCLQIPSLTNIRSIEIWMTRASLSASLQTLMEIYVGLGDPNNVLISTQGTSTQTNTGAEGGTYYKDTMDDVITSLTNFMNIDMGYLSQLIIVLPTTITGPVSLFGDRSSANTLNAIVSEVHFYNVALTGYDANRLYNMRAPYRYGLPMSERFLPRAADYVTRPLIPLAKYDIAKYGSQSANIFNSVDTYGNTSPAVIASSSLNGFSAGAPVYITTTGNSASASGAIVTPSLSGIRSIKLWVNMLSNSAFNNAVFLDFTASNPAYLITTNPSSATTAIMSAGFNNTEMYNNTARSVINARTDMQTILSGQGWRQIVFVLREPVYGALTFFSTKTTFFAGVALRVADITLYGFTLTSKEVGQLYESERSRYSLASLSSSQSQTNTTFQPRSSLIERRFVPMGNVVFKGYTTLAHTYTSATDVAFGNTVNWTTLFSIEGNNNLTSSTSGPGSLYRGVYTCKVSGRYVCNICLRLTDAEAPGQELACYTTDANGIRLKINSSVTRNVYTDSSGHKCITTQVIASIEAGGSIYFGNDTSVAVNVSNVVLFGMYYDSR